MHKDTNPAPGEFKINIRTPPPPLQGQVFNVSQTLTVDIGKVQYLRSLPATDAPDGTRQHRLCIEGSPEFPVDEETARAIRSMAL